MDQSVKLHGKPKRVKAVEDMSRKQKYNYEALQEEFNGLPDITTLEAFFRKKKFPKRDWGLLRRHVQRQKKKALRQFATERAVELAAIPIAEHITESLRLNRGIHRIVEVKVNRVLAKLDESPEARVPMGLVESIDAYNKTTRALVELIQTARDQGAKDEIDKFLQEEEDAEHDN